MKKSFHLLTSLIMVAVLSLSLCTPTLAKEENTNNNNDKVISIQISDTEALFFPSEKDYNSYLKHQEILKTQITPKYVTTHEVSRKNLYKKFIGYHKNTSSWKKTSYYILKEGTSCSVSTKYSMDGISCTLSANVYSEVETKIEADKTRESKLGIYGDYLVRHMRDFYNDQNGCYDTYDYVKTKLLDTHILVTYYK